jgi:hypothetical protein
MTSGNIMLDMIRQDQSREKSLNLNTVANIGSSIELGIPSYFGNRLFFPMNVANLFQIQWRVSCVEKL